MKDGFIKSTIKKVALLCYFADLKITRFIKGKPQFSLKGYCNNCGRCCDSPMIQTNAIFFRLKSIRWIILTWHCVINGFEYKREIKKLHTFVFCCSHWDPETKLCDSCHSRPGMCRDYPRNLIYSNAPKFFEECSFYTQGKNAQGFRQALQKLNLSQEKLEELHKKLHIKE